MITVKQLKAVKSPKDLENLGIGRIYMDIGGRGGGVGFYGEDIANYFEIYAGLLPAKFGAGCNYLGGGVRGAIFTSDFSTRVPQSKAAKLRAIAEACKRVYLNVENEAQLNDDYADGDTNWDALATKAARNAGTRSAY